MALENRNRSEMPVLQNLEDEIVVVSAQGGWVEGVVVLAVAVVVNHGAAYGRPPRFLDRADERVAGDGGRGGGPRNKALVGREELKVALPVSIEVEVAGEVGVENDFLGAVREPVKQHVQAKVEVVEEVVGR